MHVYTSSSIIYIYIQHYNTPLLLLYYVPLSKSITQQYRVPGVILAEIVVRGDERLSLSPSLSLILCVYLDWTKVQQQYDMYDNHVFMVTEFAIIRPSIYSAWRSIDIVIAQRQFYM